MEAGSGTWANLNEIYCILWHFKFCLLIAQECPIFGQSRAKTHYYSAIGIKTHSSWLPFFELAKERLETICQENVPSPKINAEGYMFWRFSRFKIMKHLMSIIEENSLPVMKRKWDKVKQVYNKFGRI